MSIKNKRKNYNFILVGVFTEQIVYVIWRVELGCSTVIIR